MVKDDIRHIRWSVCAAACMVLAGAGAVLASRDMLEAERQAHRQALAQQADIHARLARTAEDARYAQTHAERFTALVEHGTIGGERRLEWLEQMRQIKAARKLYDLQFEIAPQQAIDPDLLPRSDGDYEFRSSAMRLQMQLLHEGDLLGFIGDLRGSAHGFLRPRNCVIERLAFPGGETPANVAAIGPRLKADCVIDWITIQQRRPASAAG